jgi:hypothetical protein
LQAKILASDLINAVNKFYLMELVKSKQVKTDYQKLVLCIFLDLVGCFSYALPFIGEFFDVVWAPISGLIMMSIFKGKSGKIASMLEFTEEIVPFTDFIPTFTLTWIYTYVKWKNNGL